MSDDQITAYHGSPHDFDQFDTAKIGTGEGAQAYGHGLYFAEHEPVAKGYRDALSGDPISQEGVKPDWRDRGSKSFAQLALAQSMDKKLSGDDAIHDAMQDLHKNAGLTERKDIKQRYYDAVNSLGQMLGKEWDIHKGHMYEVNIDAHPDHFLNWDKPLSEQHPNVQKFLSKAPYPPKEDQSIGDWLKPRLREGMPEYWSYDMLKAGIHGIRYLDAGSRNAQGDPTHNYVVFDHNLVSVKRKYAQGGDVEGYGDGGNVGPKINNPMSVFPKPQRMFPEDAPVAGGQYLSMPDKQDMTGHKSAAASIGVNPGGKPYFTASRDEVDETGSPGRGSATAKTNLFKQKAGWKWKDAPEGHEDTNTIVSVEHRGQHHYALNAHFPKGVDLARYENSPSEPRLRPTTRGNVEFGPQAGSILVRGREHPVYHHVIVKNAGGDVEAYGDGGHIPVGDPRREENLAAFQAGNHPDVPHVVFHGTKIKNIDQFHGQPNWFAEEPYKAEKYARGLKPNRGDSIYPAHISLKKPLHIHDFDMNDKAEDALPLAKKLGLPPNYVEDMGKNHQFAFEIVNHPHFVEAAMQKGFDGIIANEGGYKTFGTFLPNQIKSSTGNSGNFDPSNPDITKAKGGTIDRKNVDYKKITHSPIVEHVLGKIGAPLPASMPFIGSLTGRRP